MDITWKRAENYRNMARQGVTAGTLRQDHRGGPNAWTIELWKDNELSREKAKDIVKEYLIAEFEALSITFWMTQGKGPNKFGARFRSFAL